MPRKRIAVASLLAATIAASISATPVQASTPLDGAVHTVQQDARHGHGSRTDRLAWATFQYVGRTISSVRNTRLTAAQQPKTVDQAIARRAGACGNATSVALAIADRLHLPARPVEFYYTEAGGGIGSHIMLEMNVDGRWQLYDVLFNTVYRARNGRLMGASALARLPLASQLARQERGPNDTRAYYADRGHDPYRYLSDPRSEMTINDRGTVSMQRTGNVFTVIPNRPNYIGQAGTYGTRRSDINVRLDGVTSASVTVRFSASGCTHGTLIARSGIQAVAAINTSTTSVTIPVSGSTVGLSVTGGCYMVLAGVS